MMPAAKHFDPVVGVDIHIIQPPGPVPPVPVPHPFVGFLMDPFDYVPVVGATVKVQGMYRAIAGTMGKCVPPHIPIGGTFVKPPANECEMFMGSSTVSFDGDAASYMGLPALSCHCIGMPAIPRPWKKGKIKSMVLPTSVVLPIPAGPPVLIGGPPTISLMGLGMKLGVAGLGKGLARLARSGAVKRAGKAFQKLRQKLFKNMKPGLLKCVILRAEPVDIITGEVVADQEDFSIPGRIPIEWKRHYGSHSARRGVCGFGWETPADARLVLDEDGSVAFHDGGPGAAVFPTTPEAEPVRELVDGALLAQTVDRWTVRTKTGLVYRFPKPEPGQKELLVERVEDLCGNWLQYVRNEHGLAAILESAGRRIEVVSSRGLVREMRLRHPDYREPRPLARFEYGEADDLVAVYDALDHPYRFRYEDHRLVRHTDRNGLSFYYEYDLAPPQARCVHTFGDGGLYDYHFAFDDLLGETRITDSLGHLWTVQFDQRQLPLQEIDPLGGVTQFEYDEVGRTTAVVDPGGHRTQYEYDEWGNLLKLTRPDGKCILTEYNGADNAVKIVDPSGAAWLQEWDGRGHLTRQVSPLGAESGYEYDAAGQLVGFVNPNKARTALEFDGVGNLARLIDALGHRTEFAYDPLGNIAAETNALGHRNAFTYDLKGRLTRAVLPSGAAIECGYDGEDNLIRYVDENGAETRLEYCGLGEIKRRIQPDGHRVEYHYDTEERLIGVTNQRGERYELCRDALGRVVEEIDYWGQSRHYAYTAAGHLKESVDPLGWTIRYATDPLGRILKKVLPNPDKPGGFQAEVFAYDANGGLVAAENAHIKIQRKFDAEGRLVEEHQGEACLVANDYDANGNRIARTTKINAAGETHTSTVRYRYDALDRAIAVEVEGHAPIALARDALGQVNTERLSPRVTRRRAYTADGYLTAQEVRSAETPLFEQTYTYDRAGNLVEKRDSDFGIERYSYDPVGRLVAHLDPLGRLREYLNDPAGDRLRTLVRTDAAGPGGATAWRREGDYEGVSYSFDRAGNLSKRSTSVSQTRFVWDANQRLTESATDGRITTYRYDPLGRRVSKSTNEVTTHFYWDGEQLLGDVRAEVTADNSGRIRASREWVYYPDTFEPLALVQHQRHPDVLPPACPASALYLYHNDPNGCPTRILDSAGTLVWAAQYTAWGKLQRLLVERVDNPIRLQGQYEDGETQLHYNRYRYYDASLGQFATQDPLRLLAGFQLYEYAANVQGSTDPLGLSCVRLRDPSGKFRKAATGAEELSTLPRLSGKTKTQIERLLKKRGYTGVPAHSGGKVWTRSLPDGNTMAVRLDPPVVRTPPKGWADEVPHAHKEVVPSSAVTGGNYPASAANKFSDLGTPATSPADAHIPIKW